MLSWYLGRKWQPSWWCCVGDTNTDRDRRTWNTWFHGVFLLKWAAVSPLPSEWKHTVIHLWRYMGILRARCSMTNNIQIYCDVRVVRWRQSLALLAAAVEQTVLVPSSVAQQSLPNVQLQPMVFIHDPTVCILNSTTDKVGTVSISVCNLSSLVSFQGYQ